VKLFFNPSGVYPNRCFTCFAEEAFDQAVNMPIFWLNLGGCELLMYRRYFEFAKKAISNGIYTSTAISGVGLTRSWAEQARDLGIKIKVSLDGPKRVNDIQGPETYEAAIEAIELFREIGYPVRINMVHTRLNNDEAVIDEMYPPHSKSAAFLFQRQI
jgi:MoaA/NifB/PqqE/SkfB family radical SAM enzyme